MFCKQYISCFPCKINPSINSYIVNEKFILHNSANTESDVTNIGVAIDTCAKQYHVDRRLILAMIVQESRGDVGVITTNSGQGPTAGLMQCLNCPGFPGQHGLSQVSLFLCVEFVHLHGVV